jgi:hypothetical protein
MSSLGPRDRRMLRALAFVILPAFAVAYGARPLVRTWSAEREGLLQQMELLQRERAAVAEAGMFDSAIVHRRTMLAREERAVIRASSQPTAFSELADHLRSAARREQVLVHQVSELPVDSVGADLRLLRLGVRGESDLAGITRFIRSIEADPRRIRVTRLFIERQGANNMGGGPATTDGRNVLTLHATIEALALVTASPQAAR